MITAFIVLLVLAALATVPVLSFSREMWSGDGFGRSIARSLTTLAVIVAWALLTIAWVLIAVHIRMSPWSVAGVGAALVAMCSAGWATIAVAGRGSAPPWLVVVVGGPPLLLIALAVLAGLPEWRSVVPDVLIQLAWVAVAVCVALPWPWAIQKAYLRARPR